MRRGGRYVSVPSLRLNGRWLEALGFHIGEKVEVTVVNNALMVRLVSRPLQKEAEQPGLL
jgi:antitoxin component of MazEF toxin-antitoxin module